MPKNSEKYIVTNFFYYNFRGQKYQNFIIHVSEQHDNI